MRSSFRWGGSGGWKVRAASDGPSWPDQRLLPIFLPVYQSASLELSLPLVSPWSESIRLPSPLSIILGPSSTDPGRHEISAMRGGGPSQLHRHRQQTAIAGIRRKTVPAAFSVGDAVISRPAPRFRGCPGRARQARLFVYFGGGG
jgi:hypothetical protein